MAWLRCSDRDVNLAWSSGFLGGSSFENPYANISHLNVHRRPILMAADGEPRNIDRIDSVIDFKQDQFKKSAPSVGLFE